MKRKFSHLIAHYLPQCLLLISILTSNVLFPATVIAQEIENTNNVTQEETVPIDTSEDILEEGISTSIYEEEEVVEPLFVFENGIYTVKNVVQGEEYVYPDNNNVRVKFTEVTQEGNLVIKRVELTEEQKELLNTKDSYGWDITSSMENGTFKYNLTLPNTQGNEDIEVKYTEDNNTYESIDNSNIEIKSNVVTIEGLDHFTLFVVTKTLPTGVSNGGICTVASIEGVCYNTIQAAINAAQNNGEDTINLLSDFTITQQINIDKSLTLNGNNHTIFSNFRKNDNNNSAIGIFANNVTLNNLTVDGSDGKNLHGINVYDAANVVLNNVTLKNNKNAGLVVNGSDVKVNNITTSNNGYGINVDKGVGVSKSAILTVEGTSSHHNESYPIFVDDIRKDVTVKQNNQYYYVNLLFYRRVYRLDKISPSVPVLVSPIGGISINDNTPPMEWKDSTDFGTGVSGYYLEIYSNCTNFNDVLTCQTVHSYTTEELSEYQVEDTLPENTYLWRVKAVDKAGNESNWSNFGKFTIDTPPEFSLSGIKYTYLENGVSKTEVQDRYITNWNTPVFVGNLTSTDIASVKVVINGIGYPATINKNDMTWEATISSSLLDGSYNVEIIATDLTGNTSTIEKYLFIDTKAPTAIFKHYKDNTEINETTNPVTYVKDISQLSFTGEYSDPGQSSGLYQDSFVIFQAQDDGSFAFQNNGKAAYCSWKGTQNTINLTDSTYSLTDPVSFTECTSTLPDGTYYMAHQVYDRATNKDIPSIYQFRDVLGLHFIVDNTAPTIPTATFTANGVSVPTNGYTRSKTFTFNLSSSEDTTRYQLKYWNNILGSPYKESNPWNPTDLSGYSTGLGVYNDQFMQGEGKHYFSFSACDAVGNCSAYSDPFVVTYDETPPSVPALESPIGGAYIKDNTPLMQWANSSDDYSDVKGYYYRVFHNCADISDSSTCSGVYPYLTGLWRTDSQYQAGSTPDGMYYWQVMAEDNAGNKSSWSNLEKVTIDTKAPDAPVITSPSAESYFTSTPILNQWTTVTDSSGIAYYRVEYVYDDEHSFSDMPYRTTTSTQRNHTPGTWEQGGVTIRVQAFDNAGNEGAWSNSIHYTYDETRPTIEISSPAIDNSYQNESFNIVVNASDTNSGLNNVVVHVYDESNTIVEDCDVFSLGGISTRTVTCNINTTEHSDGIYTIETNAYDLAGNMSQTLSRLFTIDTTAPEVKVISHNDGDFVHGTVTITGEISDINLSHYWFVIVDLNGTEVAGPGTVPSKDENITTSFTWDTTKNVADGKYIIKLEAKDLAGNKNPNEAPVLNDPEVEGDSADWVTVIVDNNSPIIEEYSDMTLIEGAAFPTIGTVNLTETNPEKVYISISDSSDTHTEEFTATSTFLLEDSLRQTIEKWKGSPFTTINLSVLPEGTYTISYYATDKAGNKGNEETFTITIVNNVPTVTITAGSTQITQGNSTVLGATAKNGNPPYTYQWSGACTGTESTTTFTGASTGTYTCTVTVTDADGDTASDSIDITVGAVLGATDGATTGSSTTSTNKPTTTKTNVSTYALGIGSGKDTLEQGEELLETTSIEEPSVLGERCENKKKVSGYVYIDENKDKEMNDNEEGIKDITITIQYTDEEGNIKTEEEVNTDENGYWETQLCSGKYNIVVKEDTLPKNIEVSEVLSLTVSDNEEETIFNIQALDTRNFWQKYWYLIVGGLAIIAIGYTSFKNRKKEEI